MATARSLLTTTPEPHQLAGSEHAGKDCRCLVLKKELGERWSQFEKCLTQEIDNLQPANLIGRQINMQGSRKTTASDTV